MRTNHRYLNAKRLIKSSEEIKLMEKSCRLVAETLTLVSKFVKEGVETIELDVIAEDYIRSKNGIPAFKGFKGDSRYPDFPNSLCISVEEVVVHGIPGKRKLKNGEIVSVDCGVLLNGYYGDSAITVPVGEISDEKKKLLRITEESLYLGLYKAKDNNKVYDISKAIQEHCEKNGFSLTRELVCHGIGKKLHEDPAIPNFVPPLMHRNNFPNIKLEEGMTIAIEPMVHMGKKDVTSLSDGWTIVTVDNKPAAHFEHTVLVQKGEPIILTLRD